MSQLDGVTTPLRGARIGWETGCGLLVPTSAGKSARSTLRPEPSSSQGGSLRPWPGNVPGSDVMGKQEAARLTVTQLRRLGPKALVVWRYLVDMRGYGARQLHVSLARVSAVTGLAQRSLERAVARLWRAGALDRWVYRERGPHGWVSSLYVEVYGGVDLVRGQERIWMPAAVATWADSAPSWGGNRGSKMAVHSTAGTGKMAAQGAQSAHLDQQDGGPQILSLTSCTSVSCSTNKRGLPSQPAALPVLRMIKPTPIRMDTKAIPRTGTKALTLSGDPNQPETGPAWVRSLVAAYNLACETHYPKFRRLFPPGCAEDQFSSWDGTAALAAPKTIASRADDTALTRWTVRYGNGKFGGRAYPVYAKLLAAARWLAEKKIPPQTWAEHVVADQVAYYRAKGKAPRVVPLIAVFAPDKLANPKFRAMYYQAVGPQGSTTTQPTQANYEQMYRLQEQSRIKRGVVDLWFFPPWYVALRKQEIAQGIADPMTRYPALAPITAGV